MGGVSGGKGCGFLYPKPSPWGEGGPAQPGRMRGRPGTQRSRRKPAYRRQAVGHWFSTRKGFGVIAPSSVCFADSFPPRGSRWTWQVNRPYPICTKRLPQPAQLGGGPLRALDHGPQARQKKERTPAGSPQTRKGGSREEEPLPPWCSFLRLSSKESRAPARGRAGNGALRPEAPEKPPPPKGYAVPCRTPARDRAGTHLAGANLRRSKTGPPTDRGPRPHLGPPAV